MDNKQLEIYGAKVHNLQNIDLSIPHNSLVVITGLSGSGKSSLAFDTIYAEGQRRYMETFSAYARQFIGSMERPEVDNITGLSPVIAIEQKTTNKNPRSTVGTATEIYDYLRLLYARIAIAYSHVTGEKMIKSNEEQIINLILKNYEEKTILLLSPLVVRRKGHYRELFENLRKQGYLKARVDGEIIDISTNYQLDRYKVHDIELVVDKLKVKAKSQIRLKKSIQSALKQGKGIILVYDEESQKAKYYSKMLMCPSTGTSYPEPEPNTFSFNSPYGACKKCNGLGVEIVPDLTKIIVDENLSIKQGGLAPLVSKTKSTWKESQLANKWILRQIDLVGRKYNFTVDSPIKNISQDGMNAILLGEEDKFVLKNDFIGITHNQEISFDGLIAYLVQLHTEGLPSIQKWASQFMKRNSCSECNGDRLNIISRNFKIDNKSISELAKLNLGDLYDWFTELNPKLNTTQLKIGSEIIRELRTRISFLLDVGIGYLSLNRASATLSGGESQRIRLATQIGSKLVGVLYILDEPSIGLHQRDNNKLINSLKKLRDMGNSIIVVEHDEDMIRAADYIVDIGPGAGIKGGKIVAEGNLENFLKQDSLTAQYLNGTKKIMIPSQKREGNGKFISLMGAKGHNLKNVDLNIPLKKLICVTGVSGSGKSSLITQTLHPILNNHFYRSSDIPLEYRSIDGISNIDKIVEVNQSPIGRTPRSNPVTYVGIFDDIRNLFAQIPDAKIRGYKSGRFSFNVKGGRCENCMGAGVQTIEMNFLPSVYVKCEECNGKRYNRETLEIRYKGKSINDVLNMSITMAVDFFEKIPHILHKLQTLKDVGLGYVSLGQASTTLSGGEAQRIKLAAELSKKQTGNTLYILDEPTTGLHFEDIRILLEVLQRLVDNGNTVLIIEHNLDVVKCADYIIDIGPEGGNAGGNIIAEGTPEEVAKVKQNFTAEYLRKILKESSAN